MDLDRYEDASQQHCEELIAELEEFGIEKLREACRSVDSEDLHMRISSNASAMVDYIREPPNKRKKLNRSLSAEERALFVLGSLYLGRCGQALLYQICQAGITAGPSYRMISGQAAQAAKALMLNWPPLWPFDGDDPLEESD